MLRDTFDSHGLFSFRNALLILIPLLATVIVFWKFFIFFDVPFRLDYAEGFIFTNTISLLHGGPMYHSVESAPYIFGFYTPLYNYIGALLFKLFGSSVSVLRIMSFSLFLGAGVGVGYIVKNQTRNSLAAILSSLLFCSAFIASQWSGIARPDMLGICLVAIGIAVASISLQKKSYNTILIAFIFSLAFFSKQSFVFAPLAFFISLLFINKKAAGQFAGIYAVFVATGVFFLHIFTQGEFTRQIFVFAGSVPYGNLYSAFRIFAITGISAAPLVAIAIKQVLRNPKNFFSLYFLCSLLTFFMLLRDGGIQNYLLEFVLALILLAAIGVPWGKYQIMQPKYIYPLLVVLQFFFILWSYAALPWETKAYIDERMSLFNKEVLTIGSISRILVEDPLVAYATDSAIELDPYTFGQTVDAGHTSSSSLFSDMKSGKYDYIDDYGAFNRITGLADIMNDYFEPLITLSFQKPIKPFDYSLYNRHTITEIGTIYKYSLENNQAAD